MSVETEKKIIKNHRNLTALSTKARIDNDIIVPDTQPDVKTVLQAEVLPMICEKHMQKDYIILTGNLDYSIIYLSDEKDAPSTVRSISTRVPFTHQIEVPGVYDGAFAGIKPDVAEIEFSAVNSRKINVKSTVDFDSDIIVSEDFEAVSAAVGVGELPCKTKEISLFSLQGYCENEFELSDTFSIPNGSDMIDELLKVDVKVAGREVKTISGKPVAKGVVDVCALYCDTSGQFRCIKGEMPFTEILSVDDVGTDDLCRVEYTVTDLQYSGARDSDGDASLLDIRVRINIVASVYRSGSEYIAEDIYSPDYEISPVRDNIRINRSAGSCVECVSVKDTLQLPPQYPPISNVYNADVKPYVKSAEVKGNTAHISGVAYADIQYVSSDSEKPVCNYKKEIPFSYSLNVDCESNPRISVCCSTSAVSYNTVSESCADLHFDVICDTEIISAEDVSFIKDVSGDEEKTFDTQARHGVVIYFADPGESVWDIAKHYHTTAEAINTANKCEYPDVLKEKSRIMIPRRKRE